MHPGFFTFQKQVSHPLRFRLFLLQKLPAACIAGLRIQALDEKYSVITVRYSWLTQNPFRSMYFAVQAMAAEMSTGLLVSGQVYRRNPAVTMLVVSVEAKFIKKITGKAFFTCEDGLLIAQTVQNAVATNEPQTIRCSSTGRNMDGEIVSEFVITWSLKSKSHAQRNS